MASMIDDYSHADLEIVYTMKNILGPADDSLDYEALVGDYNSQLLDSCHCRNLCMRQMCKCLHLSQGNNYEVFFTERLKYKLKYKPQIYRHYPRLECNSKCLCLPDCNNRIVQHGPMEGLLVKPCENVHKGAGLFASQLIYRGEFICEYAGELLTKTQALARIEENEAQDKMNYIICINEETFGGYIQTFVDASKFGNIGRYINHSCEPNSVLVPIRSETVVPHLAIFCCRNIEPDEEITFCYSVEDEPMSGELYASNKYRACLCNSECCKGLMPSPTRSF